MNCGEIVNGSARGISLERVQHRFDVVLRVERQRGLVLAVAVPSRSFGVFFLQVRGIGQQDIAKLDRSRVGEDRPAKAVADQAWQVAGMVQMRVRQDAPIERGRFLRERIPVAKAKLLQPLEQAAIHQQPLAFRFDQIF